MGNSLDAQQMQNLLGGTKASMVVADGAVAIRLKYIGNGTVTSVTVDISTDLVLITSDGGTDTYIFSTFATVGALADSINADGVFCAKVLDALRSAATDDMFVDGAKTITSEGYYDIVSDTTATDSLVYRITYDRNVGSDINPGNHRVALKEFTYFATLGNATADDLQIWEYDRASNTETQVYQNTPVSASNTTINFASGVGELSADFNNDLIIVIDDDTSLADSGAFLQTR